MNTVKIRLRKPRRVFAFLCDDSTLRRDEACIVESDRGLEYGICILPPEPCPPEMAKRFAMRVVRRADQSDEATHQFLLEEERKAYKSCAEKIQNRGLPMKLVDVEYTFDKNKVVFYFTADERVDFRQLVRDLAQDLRTRIELRHIQVRDEAKVVGGIGSCGRELCCSTWLNEFKPISMRMAKRQNLSLNPSKISGQCGRLLCCLSYENDQYENFKRRRRQQQDDDRQEPREPREARRVQGPPEKEAPDAAPKAVAAAPPERARSGQPDRDRQGAKQEPAREGGGSGRSRRRGGKNRPRGNRDGDSS